MFLWKETMNKEFVDLTAEELVVTCNEGDLDDLLHHSPDCRDAACIGNHPRFHQFQRQVQKAQCYWLIVAEKKLRDLRLNNSFRKTVVVLLLLENSPSLRIDVAQGIDTFSLLQTGNGITGMKRQINLSREQVDTQLNIWNIDPFDARWK